MLRKAQKLEKGRLLVQHLRPSLIFIRLCTVKPTRLLRKSPNSPTVNLAKPIEGFHQSFLFDNGGECPEQSTDLAGL